MTKNNQKWASVHDQKWPKISFGAKLRCAINEQKWTSMRNVSNSRWWQNGQVWTAVRSWDALKLNKNDPQYGILRIHANSMLWQNDPKWTSVRSRDALKMIKMNLGAQCFVIDVVSKMTQNEHRCEVKRILLKQLLQSSKIKKEPRCAMCRPSNDEKWTSVRNWDVCYKWTKWASVRNVSTLIWW